ncbi:MAG: hypothetical protein LUQ50_05005, partial [Methanospirillum sp.]|uniref:hypothetical protein n=1 Tax=Methanospirillum sp. TaxID=45200 RepID=UPI0023709309
MTDPDQAMGISCIFMVFHNSKDNPPGLGTTPVSGQAEADCHHPFFRYMFSDTREDFIQTGEKTSNGFLWILKEIRVDPSSPDM